MKETAWRHEQNLIVHSCRRMRDAGDMEAELQNQLKLFEEAALPTAEERNRMEQEVRFRLGLT